MPRFKAVIDIDAPREHVFATAGDPLKQPEWTTWITESVITSGDGKSAGTTETTTIKVGPQKKVHDVTWREYNAPEVLAREFTGYLTVQERLECTEANGGTRVEWSIDYTPPFGIIGKIGAFIAMARIFQNELEASLENLKRELEV